MHTRAIIFDMDGLMIDTESLYWAAGREVAGRYGKQVQDATLGRMMGRSPIDSMRVFAMELGIDQDYASLLEERDVMVFRQMQTGVAPMPGLLEVLVQLKARFRLGIYTSARMTFVNVALERLGIERYFDAIQTSEGVINGKPDPEIYLKAMAKLDARPGECVVLEDSSNGALAAKRAGAYTIAVPSVYTREQDFAFVDYVAKDLKDAAGHIAALDGGDGQRPGAAL
jgi:HAD superfamily hydrolase (TIGR01509 family)